MKTIIFLRHCKAEKEGVLDFDRMLNLKGEEDAFNVARLIEKSIGVPDIIIASPAERTASTAEIIAANVGYRGEIGFVETLYPGSCEEIVDVISKVDDSIGSILIVGHNPAIEESVKYLIGSPTVGIVLSAGGSAAFQANVKEWKEFYKCSKIDMLWMTNSKMLRKF